MNNVERPVPQHEALSPRRSANGRTPPGYRVLHVILPEPIFNDLKANAYLSGVRFPEYVARVLREAWPYQESRLPRQQVTSQATEIVDAGDCQT